MAALDEAISHLRAGRFRDAANILEQLAAREPSIEALHALGIARLALGDAAGAKEPIERAIAMDPGRGELYATLGAVLGERGEHAAALASCERASELAPKSAEVQVQWATALLRAGKPDEAKRAYARAIALDPKLVSAHVGLGHAHRRTGSLVEAHAAYAAALAIDPAASAAHTGRGILLFLEEDWEGAARSFDAALEIDPSDVDALVHLSQALVRLGRSDEAEARARAAIALRPNSAAAHAALGSVLLTLGHLKDATDAFEKAASLAPDNVRLATIAALMLAHSGPSTEACAILERLVERFPEDAGARDALAQAYLLEGRIERAVVAAKSALAIDPDRLDTRSFLLGLSHTEIAATDQALFGAAKEWGRMATRRNPRMPEARPDRDRDRPLRIGYVSADFRVHHTGYVMEAVLPYHDRRQVEVFCYRNNAIEDEQTSVLERTPSTWRNTSGLTHEAFAEVVRADRIDILVDLSGHTSGTRLEAFARKPAPIQVTWLGYWATTGLDAIDWILCDDCTLPPSDEHLFVEKPWRLPGCYVCIPKPRIPITVSSLPALRNGRVTFACYNNLALLGEELVRAWSAILRAVPGSRLVLRSCLLGEDAKATRFIDHGVDSDRVIVFKPQRRFDILRAYHDVDIALDPFPYSCGATSAEAIFMSVPVIAKRGSRFVSRVTESILSAVGVPYVADDEAGYIKLAVELAHDLDRLSAERATLRDRLLDSPVGNGRAFTRRLERAFRGMWHRYLDETQ